MKRIIFSVLGGILTLILFVAIGFALKLTGNTDAAQVFIKYAVGWSLYVTHFPAAFDYAKDIGATSEIYKSWLINIAVYSLLIYLALSVRAWRRSGRAENNLNYQTKDFR